MLGQFLPEERRVSGIADGSFRHSHWARYSTFYGLALTTGLATSLLLADIYHWRVTGLGFTLANSHPGTVGLLVQILAAFFGLLHVTVVCKLLNYALRLRLAKTSVSLDVLSTWIDLSIARMDWDLPIRFLFPVVAVVFLSLVPSALWAGSMTPSNSHTTTTGTLMVPNYQDVSLIKEYPLIANISIPSLRTPKGYFTYGVGQKLSGQLLASASTATSPEAGELVVHRKLDNTQYSYRGRSYGVGAAVGLADQPIANSPLVAGYIYQEAGYLTNVTCIYNKTSNFALSGPSNGLVWTASGDLPDSVDGEESTIYIGQTSRAIVALGVASSEFSPRRYLAITAGEAYGYLNSTQCELNFVPTLFDVNVDIGNLNITVVPVRTIEDPNPARNVTKTLMRQFELMSSDMTNLYISMFGEAFNSSIGSYKMAHIQAGLNYTMEDAVLTGLTNSIAAMADDMLVAYSSAQLMVGKKFTQGTATVIENAFAFGQPGYVIAIFALNLLIIFVVVFEATRTMGWSELGRFDFLDPRDLIIAASRGGTEAARAADDIVSQNAGAKMKHLWLLSDPDEGNGSLVVNVVGQQDGHVKIVVAGGEEEKYARMENAEAAVTEDDLKLSRFSLEDLKSAKPVLLKRSKMGLFGSME